VEAVSRHLNGTPLKSLGFRTPGEAFAQLQAQEERV